jgi:DNA-binding NtrC family response regulator
MQNNILVIDDEQDFLESVRRGLFTAGFKKVALEKNPQKAAARFDNGETYDAALIDITMPGMDGVELLQHIKSKSPNTECLMVTAVNEARVAVECVRKGAYDYLTKPISRDDLVLAVRNALERKRLLDIVALSKKGTVPRLENSDAFREIATRSSVMLRTLKEAELHAQSDVPVLITGESGTGKELLARAVHKASPRSRFAFTPVNMASLSGSLFDAEFFGHTRGAFTGADRDRVGYLEQTNKGTLFLDEIGHLPQDLQGKLLRVLQEGEYYKLGVSRPQRVDMRFIAATNVDLDRLLAKGLFRKDLYYRLKGAWLHLPALRDRKEDIPVLIERFIDELAGKSRAEMTDEAMAALLGYDYPGNVRELRSILQSAINLSQGRPITPRVLPEPLKKIKAATQKAQSAQEGPVKPLAEVEREHILKAYQATGKNKSQTAKLLDIGLNTLRRKLASYGLD